ncbi:MAG: PAS domain S-box protein [Desulfobaccales bacterium]
MVKMALAHIRREILTSGEMLTFQDISQQQEDQALIGSLITGSPVGIYILHDNKFVLTNHRFRAIAGYSKKELSNMEFWDLVHPEDREGVKTNALKMLREEKHTPFEYRAITKAREIKWIIETLTPIQYKGKRATLGHFIDITGYREFGEQFLHAQNEEVVGRLAGRVAHDLNNMLAVIRWYSDSIIEKTEAGNPIHIHAERILEAATRAIALADQLLAFSRKQVMEPQVLDLNVVI